MIEMHKKMTKKYLPLREVCKMLDRVTSMR